MWPPFIAILTVALVAFFAIVIYLLAEHIVYLLTIVYDVRIEIAEGEPGSGSNKSMIFKVINNGAVPVTNLDLKIASKYRILGHTEDFSTVPIDSVIKKPGFIEVHAPKLVNGAGSFILVSVFVDESRPTGYDKYSAYAVYDQGSSKADFTTIRHEFEKGLSNKSIEISLLAFGIVIAGAAAILVLTRFYDGLKSFLNQTRRKIR